MLFPTALVIGAGAFGTCIASILSQKFKKVIIKVRSSDIYESIKLNRTNEVYVKGIKLRQNIYPALTWDEVDNLIEDKIELVINGLPTTAISDYYSHNRIPILKYLSGNIPMVSLSKGIDAETLLLPDDLLFNVFPTLKDQILFLSGPSFAHEIMQEHITAVSLAGRKKQMLERAMTMLELSYFRVLLNYDIKGVLLGGALKNILAIAGGIIEGLGFNHNTRAAMITRGIAEMLRFGKVFNARPETFYGLSGMGDLILTTTGDLSRNKMFGMQLAAGKKPQEIIDAHRYVVEGYKTARAAHLISQEYDIRARIFNGVYAILYEDLSPLDAITQIMRTPSKFEVD